MPYKSLLDLCVLYIIFSANFLLSTIAADTLLKLKLLGMYPLT